jgi:hypothetical protein
MCKMITEFVWKGLLIGVITALAAVVIVIIIVVSVLRPSSHQEETTQQDDFYTTYSSFSFVKAHIVHAQQAQRIFGFYITSKD